MMYLAHTETGCITPIDVISETDDRVTYMLPGTNGTISANKSSHYHRVCNTWCEAHAVVLQAARQDIHDRREQLAISRVHLTKIENMEKPS